MTPGPMHRVDAPEAQAVLALLPPSSRDDLQRAGTRQAWVAGVDEDFGRVRLDPRRGLDAVRARLLAIRNQAGPGARVTWVVPNRNAFGLDPEEARAIADEVLAVDDAYSTGVQGDAHTVVTGTIRQDIVGVLLSFRQRDPGDVRRMLRHARRLHAARVPIAAVLIADPIGRTGNLAPLLAAARPVLRWIAGDAVLGAWLRRSIADVDVERALAAIRAIGGGPRHVLACTDPFRILPLEQHFQRWGIVADLSPGAVRNPDTPPGTLERDGSWLPGGAYQSLPFDPRVPAAGWLDSRPLRVVRTPAAPDGGLDATWRAWRGPREDLATLLDYYRFESFLRHLEDTATAQRYHEFHIFAFPSGGPAVRTTMIEVDHRVSDASCELIASQCRSMEAASHGCWRVEGADAFFGAAMQEARARADVCGADPIDRQRRAHGYLERIAPDEPLRADIVEFVRGLPDRLGRTLEIGAGTGRLARDLVERASRYVCVDLQPESMPRTSGALVSVVSDFHQLAFADAVFETVIANNVLEHAADPVAALQELRRVLTPGGRIFALMPLDALNSSYDLPAHLWKADLAGIRAAVAHAGLHLDSADTFNVYALAVRGSFPSCCGWVCRLVASHPAGV
jgi:SAM-dependent methyltransferase